MRKIFILFFLIVGLAITGAGVSLADTPQGFNYQAVARDASGNVLMDTEVDVTINLLQGAFDGPVVFSEYHRSRTTNQGLINLVIGSEEQVHFAEIDWSDGPYFLEVIVNGQTMGTSQLMSVPYALYAERSGSSSGSDMVGSMPDASEPGEMMYWDGTEWIIIPEGEQGKTLTFCDGYPHWGPCEGLPHIVHIEPVNQLLVNQGTPEDEVLPMLDSSTTIIDSDEVEHSVNLQWETSSYDGDEAGTYQATGSFSLPYGVGQSDPETPLEVIANITVTGGDDHSTVTDYDGNVYPTVKIGDQEWMAENLRVSHYPDGSPVDDGMYAYDDDYTTVAHYGKLYTWYAATNLQQPADKQGDRAGDICPPGWRLPNNNDYQELIQYMNNREMDGGTMKSTRTYPDAHPRWMHPNASATNITGFSAFPAGLRRVNGTYRQQEVNAFFWSATESTGLPDSKKEKNEHKSTEIVSPGEDDMETNMAYFWTLNYANDEFHFMNLKKQTAMSVRCIKI